MLMFSLLVLLVPIFPKLLICKLFVQVKYVLFSHSWTSQLLLLPPHSFANPITFGNSSRMELIGYSGASLLHILKSFLAKETVKFTLMMAAFAFMSFPPLIDEQFEFPISRNGFYQRTSQHEQNRSIIYWMSSDMVQKR